MPKKPEAREFFLKNILLETDECILWPYSTKNGYGQLWIEGYNVYVHLEAVKRKIGNIPENMESRHLCKNRNCFNYRHIVYDTHLNNMNDKKENGTYGWKLTINHVHWIRKQLELGFTATKIAKYLDVSSTTIDAIKCKRSWGWLEVQKEYTQIWRDLFCTKFDKVRLNKEKANEIREKYRCANIKMEELSFIYRVDISHISRIVNRKVWK